jgi:hypothetical protein
MHVLKIWCDGDSWKILQFFFWNCTGPWSKLPWVPSNVAAAGRSRGSSSINCDAPNDTSCAVHLGTNRTCAVIRVSTNAQHACGTPNQQQTRTQVYESSWHSGTGWRWGPDWIRSIFKVLGKYHVCFENTLLFKSCWVFEYNNLFRRDFQKL